MCVDIYLVLNLHYQISYYNHSIFTINVLAPPPSLIFIVPTLYKTTVEAVSDVCGICASCSFTDFSTARGCTVELQNDEFTFVFNMSRQSSEELTLLECFPVPEAGLFSVFVYEVQYDGMMGQMIGRLPHVFTVNKTAESGMIKCAVNYIA